jgi:ApeA N-terminal domain 1
MVNNFELKGQWFLPSDPEFRLSGTLIFDAKTGAILELFGALPASAFDFPIILGITSDSKEITLYKSFLKSASGLTFIRDKELGTAVHNYTVNFILEGHHFMNSSELEFDELISEILNVEQWLGISGFLNNYEGIKNKEFTVTFKLPSSIAFNINSQLSGEFNFAFKTPSHEVLQTEVSLKQRAQLVLSSQKSLVLEDILSSLFMFIRFVTLGVYQAVYPGSIELTSEKLTTHGAAGHLQRKRLRLYFKIDRIDSPAKNFAEMFFLYGNIKDDFTAMIQKWYTLHEKISPVFNLLFEQFYTTTAFNENSFLNLAQAAETLHSRLFAGTKMSKADFDQMKHTILEVAPGEYHSWLNDQFNFGNNLSLHQRLDALVERYKNSVLTRLIGDKDKFIKEVKDARNYYTHYASQGEKKALKSMDLLKLAQKLQALLVVSILIETGFDPANLERLMEEKIAYFAPHN